MNLDCLACGWKCSSLDCPSEGLYRITCPEDGCDAAVAIIVKGGDGEIEIYSPTETRPMITIRTGPLMRLVLSTYDRRRRDPQSPVLRSDGLDAIGKLGPIPGDGEADPTCPCKVPGCGLCSCDNVPDCTNRAKGQCRCRRVRAREIPLGGCFLTPWDDRVFVARQIRQGFVMAKQVITENPPALKRVGVQVASEAWVKPLPSKIDLNLRNLKIYDRSQDTFSYSPLPKMTPLLQSMFDMAAQAGVSLILDGSMLGVFVTGKTKEDDDDNNLVFIIEDVE